MTKITDFHKRETNFLSNFYPTSDPYPTLEHHYQAAKTLIPEEQEKILAAETPGAAKKLGRKAHVRSDWEKVKLGVMEELLRRKFSDPELAELLINTGDAELIEGNYWHDNFWGDCSCEKCKRKEGKNHLGKLLMKIRSELNE